MVDDMENYKVKVSSWDESKEVRYKTGSRKVCGVGINDIPNISSINNPDFWKYQMWQSMITRCFSKRLKENNVTYRDVSCDPNWLVFSKFVSDISSVENVEKYLSHGWHMDKDILIKGNKIYSLETVCFVPNEINKLLINSKKTRGCVPVGLSVIKVNGKIQVRVSKNGKNVFLGKFNNIEDAFAKYKIEKEKHIKLVAEKWKGVISRKVYDALISYEVTVND